MTDQTPLIIADETYLWCLWDRDNDHPAFEPMVSEGFMAHMLGIDRLELRTRYRDFLERHNAENAHEVKVWQCAQGLAERCGDPEQAKRILAYAEQAISEYRAGRTPERPVKEQEP